MYNETNRIIASKPKRNALLGKWASIGVAIGFVIGVIIKDIEGTGILMMFGLSFGLSIGYWIDRKNSIAHKIMPTNLSAASDGEKSRHP